MKTPTWKKVALSGIAGLVLLSIIGERILSSWLRDRISQAVAAAHIETTDVGVNLYTRSIGLRHVRWSPVDTTSLPGGDSLTQVSFKEISLKGIRIYPLIRDRKVSIRKIIAADGDVRIGHRPSSPASERPKLQVNGLDIESLQILNTSFTVSSDSMTTWSARGDVKIGSIALTDPGNPLVLASYEAPYIDLDLTNVSMNQVNGYFGFRIGRLAFDRHRQTLRCDSLSVTPMYPKVEFARRKGTQSTWASADIPLIEVYGLDMKGHVDSTLTASKVVISHARIDAFRDRRIPLRRKAELPMPMAWLRKLSMALEIDSIMVNNMSIAYEHVSEGGFAPGTIRFEELEALFLNVSNREYNNQPKAITLEARSRIMGKGLIQATFLFPLSPRSRYQAKGTIQTMPLASLNPMLENAAFVSVESGQLNKLDFQFSYDNDASDGSLTIDYQDLKLRTLKKDRSGEMDQLKTLIVNTAIRNDRNRTGTIHAERDKRRFIFHYWAASLMDGIRDAAVPAVPPASKKQQVNKKKK